MCSPPAPVFRLWHASESFRLPCGKVLPDGTYLSEQRDRHTATLRSNSLVLGEHQLWAMLCGYQVLRHLTADTGSGGDARPDPLHHVGVRHRPSRSGGTTARPTRPPA